MAKGILRSVFITLAMDWVGWSAAFVTKWLYEQSRIPIVVFSMIVQLASLPVFVVAK
jgi:hypothetical protein